MTDNRYKFAEIILPLPLHRLFTYEIPETLTNEIKKGVRVVVQFGKKKFYTGIVYNLHNQKPEHYEVKTIHSLLDTHEIVNQNQLSLWHWIASYYMCSVGEVMKAALPSGLKIESETNLAFNPKFEEIGTLNENELFLFHILEKEQSINMGKLEGMAEISGFMRTVNKLIEKKAIVIEEKIKSAYKVKTESYVNLCSDYHSEEKINQLYGLLEKKAPKQLEALMRFLSETKYFTPENQKEITRTELSKLTSAAAVKALADKGIVRIEEREINRIASKKIALQKPKTLSEEQQTALNDIQSVFTQKKVCLLHGVTSSGKTEVYIHLIQQQLNAGKQVLYLLPEIALTTQIINRLRNVFGDKVLVYHSKFSDAERVEIYKTVLNNTVGNAQLILGVRSSVFLPYTNLSLIIADEEHENTYKQYDPAPRYNARDTAIWMGFEFGAKILLGTATPSLETYYNSLQDRYGLVELFTRYQNIQLPEILIANAAEARRKKIIKGNFTPLLYNEIAKALDNKEQVILFQNRRGYAPFLECETCGWVPQCKHCNVSLTYHKYSNDLNCHYCGFTIRKPKTCESCGNPTLYPKGFGTEKIEDEIVEYFPTAKVARMDLDTTRRKHAFEKLIGDFENGNIDILIGTQMVSKGLDFDRVSLVGILNADNMLNYPDFRAHERSFQMMSQVAGRAGRKYKQGKVIIQTSDPNNVVIKQVLKNDFKANYNYQLNERALYKYPPFYRLIVLTLKHKNKEVLNQAAVQLADLLRKSFGTRILGPEPPPIDRIQNWFISNIIVKIERDKSSAKAKEIIYQHISSVKSGLNYKSLQVIADVDPM